MVAIYNRTRPRAEKLAAEFAIADIYSDTESVLQRDDIDVISISMPNNMHYDLSLAAIDAGKHVYCEKPLAMNFKQADEMWARAERAGVKTGMQFNTRNDPVNIKIKNLLEEGYVGEVNHIELNFASDFCANPDLPMMWRFDKSVAGTGALGDLGVYVIDTARWLIGEFSALSGMLRTYIPERRVIPDGYDLFEVLAMGRTNDAPTTGEMAQVDNDDEAIFLARFENGITGQIKASRINNDPQTKLLGTEGVLMKDPRTNKLLGRRRGEREFSEVDVPPRDQDETIVSQFVRNIRNDSNIGPTFYDGKQNQAVIDAVVLSATQQRWVQVDEIVKSMNS